METKVCSVCKIEKELNEYYSQPVIRKNKLGEKVKKIYHQSNCKECAKKYNKDNYTPKKTDELVNKIGKDCVCCKQFKEYVYFPRILHKKNNRTYYQSYCKGCKKNYNKSGIDTDIQKISLYEQDLILMDTMIEIYQERGLKHITEALKVIGKTELKRLAHERLNK